MTGLEVRASEMGVTRVFHLDLPAEAVARFTTVAGTGEWPLRYALGAEQLRADLVDVVAIRDLGGMSLASYLEEAHGVEGPEFERDRARLDALRGHVVIVPAQAFEHTAQRLSVQAPLSHVGTYGEVGPSEPAAPLRSRASAGAPLGGSAPAGAPGPRSPLLRALAIVVLALIAGVVLFLVVGAVR